MRPGKITAPPPDRSSLFHNCLHELCGVLLAAWKGIIGEGHIWTYKDIAFKTQPIPELHATLYCYSIFNHHITFDEYLVTDIAIISHLRTGQQVCEPPDSAAGTNGYTLINEGVAVDKSGCVDGHG